MIVTSWTQGTQLPSHIVIYYQFLAVHTNAINGTCYKVRLKTPTLELCNMGHTTPNEVSIADIFFLTSLTPINLLTSVWNILTWNYFLCRKKWLIYVIVGSGSSSKHYHITCFVFKCSMRELTKDYSKHI